MFKFLKKKKPREAHELFSSGKIFDAKDKELDNILKKISNETTQKEKMGFREVIRTLIALNIKSNRHQKGVNNLNILLSVIIIILSIWTYQLVKTQTYYAEIESRGTRIKEANSRTRAIEYCEQNPDSLDSGLFYTSTGGPAPCSEVLKIK